MPGRRPRHLGTGRARLDTMQTDELTGDLLGAVSRTFAVSIRILPARLREPMAVAYLLARTSDTVADSEGVATDVRVRRLDDFSALVAAGADPARIAAIQTDIHPLPPGERRLLAALPRVLGRLEALPSRDRDETRGLLATIVAGQRCDLVAFADPRHVTALPDARALEAYTQAVAGSVGEWWTRMCCRHFGRYSDRAESDLVPLGSALGRALQLVNILRDMPGDLRAGRCYLPADELRAAGVEPGRLRDDPAAAQPVFAAWSEHARRLLDDGREYVRAVRPWRARFACDVPRRLAGQTLDIMQRRPPLTTAERVKMSRSAVRGTLLRAGAAALGVWPRD